jgi:hypothetical protein
MKEQLKGNGMAPQGSYADITQGFAWIGVRKDGKTSVSVPGILT